MLGRTILVLAALALLGYAVGLVHYDGAFPASGEAAAHDTVALFVAATFAVALLHVCACVAAHRTPPRLRTVLLVAGAARLILLFGAPGPGLEGDPDRLRYDARLVNQGVHPWAFTPAQLADTSVADATLDWSEAERLTRARAAMTASTDAPRPADLDRPHVRSQSMPLSLWVGALADRFKPGNTRGFAFFVLVGDCAAIFFLVLALRELRYPVGWVLVYAWSPILLQAAFGSLALDPLLLPALAALVWCIAARRRMATAVPLAVLASVQPAFLALLPVLWRRIGALGSLAALLLLAFPFVPFYAPDVPIGRFFEGHLHVWRYYEFNSVFENVLRGGLRQLEATSDQTLMLAGVPLLVPGQPVFVLLAKTLTLLGLLSVTTFLAIRDTGDLDPSEDVSGGFSDLFVAVAALLVLGPALHPWHACWLLPLLVVRPSGLAWVSLPALVSLSYLTHLAGPDAADLTLLGGLVSFRIFEYLPLVALYLLDHWLAYRLFPLPEEMPGLRRGVGTEEDLPFEYDPLLDVEYAESV